MGSGLPPQGFRLYPSVVQDLTSHTAQKTSPQHSAAKNIQQDLHKKSSNISKRFLGLLWVGTTVLVQSQFWPYSSLYLLLKFTVAPKVHSLFPPGHEGVKDEACQGSCFLGLGRGEGIAATTGMYWGVPEAIETCWMLLQYEAGCEFPRGKSPRLGVPRNSSAV